jgi:membrane protease YdiL (CAAX protease family)
VDVNLLLGLLPGVFALLALILFRRRRQPVLRSFGISLGRLSGLDVLVGLVIPAIAFALILATEWGLRAIDVLPGTIRWPSFVSDVLLQLLLAAALEELIYRVGLVSGVVAVLERVRYGRWIAVVFTGALFGAAHLGNEGASWIAALGTGLGGVIYAVAFIATRSFVLPLALHLSWNMSEGLFGFPISGHLVPGFFATEEVGPILITGGVYGPEAGIPGVLARFVVLALLFLYLKRRWRDGSITQLRFAPDPVRRIRHASTTSAER